MTKALSTSGANGKRMWFGARSSTAFILLMFATAQAQTRVITMRTRQDQIGLIKTARGITTRLSFQETPAEIICGDLYDPNSGTGGFVVQRSGNDVFLKPVVPEGTSDLFVKTGENGKNVYSFDLVIVSQAEAFRIVNVLAAQAGAVGAGTQAANATLHLTDPPTIRPISGLTNSFVRDIPRGTLPIVEIPPPPPPKLNQSSRAYGPNEDHKPEDPSKRRPIKRVLPEYPAEARRRSLNGEVLVEVGIDEKGKVTTVRPIEGDSVFVAAALSAARKWIFSPGTSIESTQQDAATIKFEFHTTGEIKGSSR